MNRLIAASIGLWIATYTGTAGVLAEQEYTTSIDATRRTIAESMRDLWRCDVQVPQSTGRFDKLAQTIRRIENVRFPESTRQPRLPERPTIETSQADRNATPRPTRVTFETLEGLRRLSKNVTDPSELAESLFGSGQPESAVAFYEMAIAGAPEAEDKAWLLFQKANCQKETDALAAAATFEVLMTEHPDSLWCSVARTQKSLIQWRDANGLSPLLKEIEKASLE